MLWLLSSTDCRGSFILQSAYWTHWSQSYFTFTWLRSHFEYKWFPVTGINSNQWTELGFALLYIPKTYVNYYSWHVTLKLPLSVHYKAFSWDLIVESNGTETTKARVLHFPTTEDLFQSFSKKFCKAEVKWLSALRALCIGGLLNFLLFLSQVICASETLTTILFKYKI